jgi:DNA-binding LytR/AlgR family response regulator
MADDGRFLLRGPIGELERRWSGAGFARVHRAYVVNLARIVEVRAVEVVLDDGATVPVARRNAAELRRRLGV